MISRFDSLSSFLSRDTESFKSLNFTSDVVSFLFVIN